MSIFTKIGDWIANLFNAMKHYWNKLETTEQDISIKASGIIAILNANLDKTPEVILKLVQAKFPEVTAELLHEYLAKGASVLKIADGIAALSFEDAIKAYQTYLSTHTGNGWVATTQSAVSALLTVLLPETTPLQKITTILQFIYEHFVKGKIA